MSARSNSLTNMKQLTEDDLRSLYYILRAHFSQPDKEAAQNIAEFAKKYYGPEVVLARVEVTSEYNDSTYDNRVQYIAMYDKDGNEVPPLPRKGNEARRLMPGMYRVDDETRERITDDICISLSNKLPCVYMEVK